MEDPPMPFSRKSPALEDYEMQLKLLEQPNKKQLLKTKQEQGWSRSPPFSKTQNLPQQVSPGSEPSFIEASPMPINKPEMLSDSQMQLMHLEQQKKRRSMAEQEHGWSRSSPSSETQNLHLQVFRVSEPSFEDPQMPVKSQALQDYEMLIKLLEQKNKKRLLMARQEPENDYESQKQRKRQPRRLKSREKPTKTKKSSRKFPRRDLGTAGYQRKTLPVRI